MLSVPHKDVFFGDEGEPGGSGKEDKFFRGIKVVRDRQKLDLCRWMFRGKSDLPYGNGPRPQSSEPNMFSLCPNLA